TARGPRDRRRLARRTARHAAGCRVQELSAQPSRQAAVGMTDPGSRTYQEDSVSTPTGHDHEDIDWDAMAVHLEREAGLRVPFVQEAVAWLRGLLLEGGCGPDTVARVLDVGSGPGVFTSVLAASFTQAEVVAVDGEPA